MRCGNCGHINEEEAIFCAECGEKIDTLPPAPDEITEEDRALLDMVRQHLGEKYRIDRVIGRGGMAVVLEVIDLELNRRVALKVLPLEHAHQPDLVKRFKKEAQLAAALHHPNIVPVYSVGSEGNVHYFSMAFLGGGSLEEKIRHGMTLKECIRVVSEVADALNYAHKKRLIHRDIKPGNILFDAHGTVYVVDFGIAKAMVNTMVTATKSFFGTPHYMSPEQVVEEKVDGRADLYALGVMFYQMVTGQFPFDGNEALSVMYKHVNLDPENPSEISKTVPLDVSRIVLKLMAKDRDQRYRTGAELLSDIEVLPESVRGSDDRTEPSLPKIPESIAEMTQVKPVSDDERRKGNDRRHSQPTPAAQSPAHQTAAQEPPSPQRRDVEPKAKRNGQPDPQGPAPLGPVAPVASPSAPKRKGGRFQVGLLFLFLFLVAAIGIWQLLSHTDPGDGSVQLRLSDTEMPEAQPQYLPAERQPEEIQNEPEVSVDTQQPVPSEESHQTDDSPIFEEGQTPISGAANEAEVTETTETEGVGESSTDAVEELGVDPPPPVTKPKPKPKTSVPQPADPLTPRRARVQAALDRIGLVPIPAGRFDMGGRARSEKPVHALSISAFEIGRTEVTQELWRAVMGVVPACRETGNKQGDMLPVENISWNDIQDFFTEINRLMETNFRLPTEAEWEYVCKTGVPSKSLKDQAWYAANSGNRTRPVGQKQPNRYGIADLQGNVWEWTQDWYDRKYYKNSPPANPPGPAQGKQKVIRGGGWDSKASSCTCTKRDYLEPSRKSCSLGFRLAQ